MVSPFPRLQTAVVIFVLILGNPSAVQPTKFNIADIISAASQTVGAGATMVGTSMYDLMETSYRVTCAIQMENWTRYPLYYVTARVVGGTLSTAPSAVLPSKREAFATRKANLSVKGVWGFVSWEVKGADRCVVLMWYVPFNFRRGSCWMGLGMTRRGLTKVPEGKKWFDQMYYHESDNDLKFIRKKYRTLTDPITFRDDKFEIEGIMTNVYQGQVKVTLRPLDGNAEDLSDPIRILLEYPQNCTTCVCTPK